MPSRRILKPRRAANKMPRKKPKFDVRKEIRKLARERVGTVPSARVIVPKFERKKPKHKKKLEEEGV
jgi:hypothetical protein